MLLGCSLYSYSFAADTPEDEYVFQGVSLFGENNKSLDLGQFEDEEHLEPGHYLWQILVNQKSKAELLIEAQLNAQTEKVEPCFSLAQLNKLNIKTISATIEQSCIFPTELSPYLSYKVLQDTQKIELTVPDALLAQPENDVNDRFYEGNNSFFTNYNYNYNRSEQIQTHLVNEQHFLGLYSGLNAWGWFFRHDSHVVVQDHVIDYQAGQYQFYRDLPDYNARLSAGHVNAGGQNSVTLFGLKLETDSMMRPEGERYYTPIIENVAQTYALVKVLQNGRVVYEKSVTPGPFRIDQLHGLNRYGDLTLEIYENDQSVRRFIIPYAMQLSLLPYKQFNYKVAVGDYIEQNRRTGQHVVQGVFEYGLTPRVNVSTELSFATDYISMQLGAIYNNQWGGFNTLLDYAQSERLKEKGYKLQFNYQTQSDKNGTSLAANITRYSIDFPYLTDSLNTTTDVIVPEQNPTQSIQQDVQLSLSQRLSAQAGSLSFSTLFRQYWQTDKPYQQIQMSYANTWRKLQYSLSYSYIQDVAGSPDRNMLLSLSIPLGRAKMSASIQQQKNERDTLQTLVGYSDSLGLEHHWNYGLSASQAKYEETKITDFGVQLGFNNQMVQASSYYTQNDSNRQWSFSTNGAWVAHRYGLTFSPTVGETFAIGHIQTNTDQVNAKDWGQGYDRWGNRVYPNLNPYNRNSVNVNPKALPLNVELDALAHEISPRRYSSPLLVFKATRRENVVLLLQGNDALSIPLGESVQTAQQQIFGLAGQGNQIFLDDMKLLKNGMRLHWGKGEEQSCQLSDIHFEQYDQTSDRLQMLEATCR